MKILQLCPKPPFPATDGGSLAMNAITEGLLKAGAEVKIFTLSTTKHPFCGEQLSDDYIRETGIVHHDIDTEPEVTGFLGSFFGGTSYILDRFYSSSAEKELTRILVNEKFDAIHLEGLFMGPYIPSIRKVTNAPVFLRAHNVESDIWFSLSEKESGPKKWLLRHLANRLKKEEITIWNRCDGIAAISNEDASVMKRSGNVPVEVFPFGMDDPGPFSPAPEKHSVFHLGAMDWIPNQKGVDWFLENVWPGVADGNALARLHLAGRNMPERFLKTKTERIFVDGMVESADQYMKNKRIMVVPVFSASGIRIKILEGMMLGKTIVSTPEGLRGIPAENGRQVLIANNAADFRDHILKCLNNEEFCDQIGMQAREWVLSKYLKKEISENLLKFYRKIAEK